MTYLDNNNKRCKNLFELFKSNAKIKWNEFMNGKQAKEEVVYSPVYYSCMCGRVMIDEKQYDPKKHKRCPYCNGVIALQVNANDLKRVKIL